jgi:hypothetical protein
MQNEITVATDFLNDSGHVAVSGWARKEVFKYDPSKLRVGRFRIKAWDFWELYNQEHRVILNIYDIGYTGVAQFSFTDFKKKKTIDRSIHKLLPLGSIGNPNSLTYVKPLRVQGSKERMTFSQSGDEITLECYFPKTRSSQELSFKATLNIESDMDRMVNVIPFTNPNQFAYAIKMNCVPLKEDAALKIGDEKFVFFKDRSFAVLDWTRAVFPYRNQWKWCSASGRIDGEPFGFNLDYGFGTESSKSMLFHGKTGHNLDQVYYQHDTDDLEKTLAITSNDERVNLSLRPTFVEKPGIDLGFLAMKGISTYGLFTGKVVLDSGKVIEIREKDQLFGWAEEYYQRW